MTWKAKRRFYDHGKGRVIEIGEVVELDGHMLKHAQEHDLIEEHIVVRKAAKVAEVPEPTAEVDIDNLRLRGTKAELLEALDKVTPGHEHSMKESSAQLKDALALATD